jgi:ABC-2 type transporter
MSLILYFGLGADDGIKYFLGFVLCAMEVNLIGCIMGYWCGVLFKNSDAARQTGTLLMIVFHLLSGGLSNSAAVNPFIDKLQYISPNRYSVELFFRIITYNSNIFAQPNLMTREQALASVGFTIGDVNCYIVLVAFIFFFILLGWFTIV